MRSIATIIVLVVAAAAIYWFMVRPVLAQWAAFKPLYDTLNEVEATFWFKFNMWFKGLKGVLMSWAVIITPTVLMAVQFFNDVDVTLFLPVGLRPYWPATLVLVGGIFLRINAITDTPRGSPVPRVDSVVEVPTAPGNPDVVIATSGVEVVAVAPMIKAPEAIMAAETVPVKVAEVIDAAQTGATVVVEAKEPA